MSVVLHAAAPLSDRLTNPINWRRQPKLSKILTMPNDKKSKDIDYKNDHSPGKRVVFPYSLLKTRLKWQALTGNPALSRKAANRAT